MSTSLKTSLATKTATLKKEIEVLLAAHGNTAIADVTLSQAYGGMRDIKCMVTETSSVDPQEGIRYRGMSIPDLQAKLPKAPQGKQPLPEGVFWLLLTGDVPTEAQVAEVTASWRANETLPEHVMRTLDQLPISTHPMTQLSIGILAMQNDSIFAKRYREGMPKSAHWDAMYDDVNLLLGRMPVLAAYIYRRSYKDGKHIAPSANKGLDWSANLAHMLGFENEGFRELMRLYMSIHADHEGGNVSAHTTHLVGSALSDPYLCLAAGMNGLAGPLHGLANQEVMRWLVGVKAKLGGGVPSKEQLSEFVWNTLNGGQVIPGYGHGVLRVTDPRYLAQREFALQNLPDDENFRIVKMLYEIVPDILMKQGKAKDPWPNVDAHSGVLLVHYGMNEYDFFTVLFGVSRAMGVLASLILDRALGSPLERPKSVTTEWVKKKVAAVASVS
jgi:citrate synthase